jgi:O-6-methylguanine DNA methyltransferase
MIMGYRACKVCKPDDQTINSENFFKTQYTSPLGMYIIISSERGVVYIEPRRQAHKHIKVWLKNGANIHEDSHRNHRVVTELDLYFQGKLHEFNVPLDLRGTNFQLKVWRLLLSVPYGKTCSYRDIARSLGQPRAARAVGGAVGSNPISIIVPCHRIIGANGSLTGYGGGLSRKRALLSLEKKYYNYP